MTLNPLSASPALNALSSKTMKASASNSSTSGNETIGLSSGQSIDTTFLNLLVTELKTQDPTSPMDPTAMVGQMVSLNQLDQLIAIRQILTGTPTASTSGATTQATAAARSNSAAQNAYAAVEGK